MRGIQDWETQRGTKKTVSRPEKKLKNESDDDC